MKHLKHLILMLVLSVMVCMPALTAQAAPEDPFVTDTPIHYTTAYFPELGQIRYDTIVDYDIANDYYLIYIEPPITGWYDFYAYTVADSDCALYEYDYSTDTLTLINFDERTTPFDMTAHMYKDREYYLMVSLYGQTGDIPVTIEFNLNYWNFTDPVYEGTNTISSWYAPDIRTFTPAESGRYRFFSDEWGYDTMIYIFDKYTNLIGMDDDSGYGNNAQLDIDLEKGELYYIVPTFFEDNVSHISFYLNVKNISQNGLVGDAYGNYWYYVDGDIDTKFTGFVPSNGTYWYVWQGQLASWVSGLAADPNGYWVVDNGQLATWITGLWQDAATGNYYLVINGQVYTTFTGLWEEGGQKWYIYNGQLATWLNNLAPDAYGNYWLITGGVLYSTYTGIFNDGYGNDWLIYQGQLASWHSGCWTPNGSDVYFFWKGQLAVWLHNQLAPDSAGQHFLVEGGHVVTSFTGIAADDYGSYWYVVNGQVQFGYYGSWNGYYINNGKVTNPPV